MNVRSTNIHKQDGILDPASRLIGLVDAAEPRLTALFTVLMKNIQNEFTLTEIETLLTSGQIDDAIDLTIRSAIRYSAELETVFINAGQDTARFISAAINSLSSFDVTTSFIVNGFQQKRLELVRNFTEDMRQATGTAIREGIAQGLNPRQQARNFRDSIGLSSRQVEAVNNYRRVLNNSPSQALTRELRDKRFDPTVRRAAKTGVPLTQTQIDRMVSRYSEKQLRWRSEMIARTEALSSVNAGASEMYRQSVENGDLIADDIEQEWHTAIDGREREWHNTMNEQKQPFGSAFISGKGNRLKHPGDGDAPLDEVIQCRCAVSRRIVRISL